MDASVILIDNYDSFTFNLVHDLANGAPDVAVRCNDTPDMIREDHAGLRSRSSFLAGSGLPLVSGRNGATMRPRT
jgi:hypothetical protein